MHFINTSQDRQTGKPPLKVSQSNRSFCAIASLADVDHHESQGYLPRLSAMQVQEINHLTELASETAALTEHRQERAQTKYIPMGCLNEFDPVDSQFATFQVWFGSAIALYPSNPKFQSGISSVALMPTQQGRSLKVTLGNNVAKVEVTATGSQPVVLSTLDAQGYCVTSTQTQAELRLKNDLLTQYTPKKVVLDTVGSQHLRIDSRAPFIITHFAVVYS